MAEAFALTCLGNFGEIVMGNIGDCLVAPIRRQFTYMCCFNSNITELETQMKKLETTRQEVQLGVDGNRRNVRVVGPTVEAWLKRGNEVTTEVEGIIQDKAKVKEGCLNGWCPNLKLRYSLSRKAVKKTTVVVDLQKDGVQYTQSFYPPPPPCLETIPNRDFMVFNSRRLTMEDIIKALTDDGTTLIGICGLPGVGKTKMVQEVRKRAKEEKLFDEVAFVAVGQDPELTKVQNSIGDIFGLDDLKKLDDATTRASLICRRLSQDNKRILLILDDIWAEIDLEDQGIPLGGSHESLKILYTSRFRGIWHDVPTKKEIALGLLSEEEAWQLFREKAGDLADTPDLQPIAKQIVNKCGGLPLALIIFGRTLSKKSRERFIKDTWEDMCERLICPSNIPTDKVLSSSLELSYNFVEDEGAKRLFLLCCLFREDESIWVEDLARFAYGLSLFDGVNEMRKVRHRVFALIDDLKSRYLLLDGESIHSESVMVHDVVRDMGISIASKDKGALVSHGAEWPKKDTYEHYTSTSVILSTITELPQGLTWENLELLMTYYNTRKKLPHNFFEGMEKLKVLCLCKMNGIPTLRSLRNLRTLTLEYGDMLPSVSDFGSLLNLEILCFNSTSIKELPEEIGELVNLRLLDLRHTDSLDRIPPGVISRLVRLEELHLMGSKFIGWEGEGKEQEGRNANLRELECLSNLHTLHIVIRNDVLIPKVPIFSKLQIYTVALVDSDDHRYSSLKGYEKQLSVISSNPIPLDGGGIDWLLRSADYLFLEREGCNDLVRELVRRGAVDGLQQLKNLEIVNCDTPECLVNTMNPVQRRNPNAPALFPILEKTSLYGLQNLREICRGPVPACSFRKLTQIAITNCGKLKNLFQLPIVGCLTQLKTLTLEACEGMEEVIQKEQRGDFATIRIEFPKLEYLTLAKLPSLTGFCRGIDQIDFPQLKYMYLRHLGQFKCLFHNNGNLSSNSEENHSLFPQKVSLPNLEVLDIADLENLERLGHGPLSVGSLSKLKEFSVNDCGKLLCVFASHLLPMLQDLEKLIIKCCNLLEVVFELEGVDCNEPNPEILSPLKLVELHCLPKLNYISRRDPMGFKYIQTLDIIECDSLRCVFSPTMTKIIPQLRKLKIWSCEKLSRIVAEENGLGESTMDAVEFPQLETVELRSLPNLVSFFPNMNTTLGKSTGHYHNPLQSQPLFNEKVAVPSLKYLELIRLENVSNLWCGELPTSSFSKLKKLEVRYCASLRNIFHPSMARGLVNLQELLIKGCSTLEAVVGKEEEVQGGHGRNIDKTLFPQLGELQLGSLPNLRRFCHFTHPLELPFLSEMDILFCPRMDEFSLGHVSTPNLSLPDTLWNGDLNNAMQLLQKNGDDPMVISKEKPRTLDNVTDKTTPCQLAEIVDPTQLQLVVMPDSTNSAHKVAQLLYNRSGDGVLAARSNGILRLWKWGWSEHNLTGKATARIVPHLWQPPNGQVMANDLTGVNLEKAVPCMALSEKGSFIISACGGKFKVFNLYTFKVLDYYIPPPPASTFAAFYPQCNILAIGMEDSTIHIYNAWGQKDMKSKLNGHQKCITGLVISTNLKILVSSGADAQLCIWNINTWEKLKSVPIQLPAGKARNGDTRVQFHSDQTHLLVSHETQLAIYDASNMDRIRQWVPQDVLPAPISFAAYSCNNQIVYTSFCDGNIGVFDADSLTLQCRIAPFAYLSPTLLSGSQAVYPSVIAAHPQKPGQFAIGLTEGSVIVMERPTIRRVNGMLNGRTASSSNASNHKPDQKREKQYWSLDDDSYSYSDDDDDDDDDNDNDDDDDDDDDDDSISSLSKNGVDRMSRSMEKPTTLDDVTDKTTLWPLAEIVDPTQCRLVAMPDSTNEAHKVARVLYTYWGDSVLALQCNGIITLWKWGSSQHNRSGMATASVVPQQWQPASGLAMTNDLAGAKLEEAVPCIALANNGYVISACGGAFSLFNMMTFKVEYMFMPPPPASTFLAVYPKETYVVAIGMEDSTIHIFYGAVGEVQYILKGHQKRITGLAFSVNLKILVSSGADAQLCTWSLETWDNLKSVPIQLPTGKPCNGNTRVEFDSYQIHLLVSHETQLAIYDASKMDRICQWVPHDVLPAPISCGTYSCDSQLVYTSFCDGNIGVFDADSLKLRCRIVPSTYLSPALSSGSQAVYPLDIATHPWLPGQFAIGLTDGSVIVMEPPKKTGLDGGIASSSNASNQTPDQGEVVDVDEDLDEDVDEDALITTRTRTRTATTDTHDDEEDLEEKRKKEEEKEKKGKAPLSGGGREVSEKL